MSKKQASFRNSKLMSSLLISHAWLFHFFLLKVMSNKVNCNCEIKDFFQFQKKISNFLMTKFTKLQVLNNKCFSKNKDIS